VIATAWSLLNRTDELDGPSVANTLEANRPPGNDPYWSYLAAAILGAGLVAITIYRSYRFAQSLARVLSEIAMNAVIRLSRYILLCIGLQIGWNGMSALLHSVLLTH
jgi:multiple antibiotic resistance protein